MEKKLPIENYKKKRNFSQTPEPEGEVERKYKERKPLSFVIHEHHASHLHWDFRLEMEGVLKSWALPKGVPQSLKEKRLAVQTEDHPLEYLTFEGKIPEGEYGAGQVIIFDIGTYDLIERKQEKIEFILDGKKVKGKYALIKFKGQGKNWLLIKLS